MSTMCLGERSRQREFQTITKDRGMIAWEVSVLKEKPQTPSWSNMKRAFSEREALRTAAFTQGRGCKSVQEQAELRELVTWCPAENNGLRDVFALCLTAKAHRPLRWWEMEVELHFTCTPELDGITHNVGLSGQALQCHRAFIKVLERYWR